MGIPQHSLNPGRAVPNSRDHGQEMLFEAAGTITADALVFSSADSSGRAVVTMADDDASRASADGALWVAIHAAAAGQQVRCASYRILSNVDASSGAVGGAVYLSDLGGWSHTAGTVRKRVGTFLDISATLGVVELAPQASFSSETLAGAFISSEQTGDGSLQTIAHLLGRAPTTIIPILTATKDSDTSGANTAVLGTGGSASDATNVKITVTNTAKYIVIAF